MDPVTTTEGLKKWPDVCMPLFSEGTSPSELHLVTTVSVATVQVTILYKLKELLSRVANEVGIGQHSNLGLVLGRHSTVSICTLEERPQGGGAFLAHVCEDTQLSTAPGVQTSPRRF